VMQYESSATGPKEPSKASPHKTFEGKIGCGDNGELCDSKTLVQVQEPEVRPPRFKAMTWNILADGLSEDGFVMRQQSLLVRAGNAWDVCIELSKTMTEKPNYAFDCLSAKKQTALTSQARKNASIGEFIVDQERFKILVVNQVTTLIKGSLKDKVQNISKCMFLSVILKVYGAGLQQYVETGFVDNVGDVMNSELFKFELKALRKKASKDEDCKNIGEPLFASLESASTQEKFLQLLMNAALNLNDKWDLKAAQEETNTLLRWAADGSTALAEEQHLFTPSNEGRGMSLLAKIFKEKPDILAVQELDHYRFFQDQLAQKKYATTLTDYSIDMSAIRYNMSIGCAQKQWTDYSIDEKATCRQEKRFAHASKFGSNAQKFNNKKLPCSDDLQCHDNDGVALFWNYKRFKARRIEIEWMNDNVDAGDGGFVGVLLADLESTHPLACIWVFTAHLSSGEKARDERARIAEVTKFALWMKQLKDSTTKHEHDCGMVGLLVMMDGNSYQDFANDGIKVDENMFHTLQSKAGVTNFQLADSIADSKETLDNVKRRDLPAEMAVSVNKIRGIHTCQLSKLGEYQLDRIDYLAVGGRLDRPKTTSLQKYKRDPRWIKQAYDGILPSRDNPSDHYPVIADVEWSGVSGLTLSLLAALVIVIPAVLHIYA